MASPLLESDGKCVASCTANAFTIKEHLVFKHGDHEVAMLDIFMRKQCDGGVVCSDDLIWSYHLNL